MSKAEKKGSFGGPGKTKKTFSKWKGQGRKQLQDRLHLKPTGENNLDPQRTPCFLPLYPFFVVKDGTFGGPGKAKKNLSKWKGQGKKQLKDRLHLKPTGEKQPGPPKDPFFLPLYPLFLCQRQKTWGPLGVQEKPKRHSASGRVREKSNLRIDSL